MARVNRVAPTIRPYRDGDLPALVALSLRAWAPVHASLEQVLGDAGGYRRMHPDWRVDQRAAVETACTDEQNRVWVAVSDGEGSTGQGEHRRGTSSGEGDHREGTGSGEVVGFAVAILDREPGLGEITMVAVDPAHQGRGTGSALMSTALTWLDQQGMTVAMVETGGDAGHAPARRLYERAGFVLLPIARYFRTL